MRISEVARVAGCSVRAVRHYHESGALPEPPRTASGYRNYGVSDLAALLRVRSLVEAGVSLADIRAGSPTLLDAALRHVDEQLAALRAQRRRLLALRDGDLGLPADLRTGIRELLGDTAFTRTELDALDLMGLNGVASAATWDVLRTNLRDPARRAEALEFQQVWADLGTVDAESAAADSLIARCRELADGGLTHGMAGTLTPGDAPLTPRDVPTRGAQARALTELAAPS